jgi:hypothetical protein
MKRVPPHHAPNGPLHLLHTFLQAIRHLLLLLKRLRGLLCFL